MEKINKLKNLWKYFDKIYCINLYEREDRYNDAKNMFQNIGLDDINFYRTYRHPNGGQQGCFESHINIIKKAYDSGAENCLIFEDDAYPLDFSYTNLYKCIEFMKNNNHWNVFYLGAFPNIKYDHINNKQNHFYQIHPFGCHAYVIHRKYMEKIKDLKFNGTEIDILFMPKNNNYSYYKSLFYQKASKSDIDKRLWDSKHSDIFKQLFFRLFNFYAYYIGYNIYKISMIILLFIICIIIYYKQKNKII
jgi:GR25 family glycosyltransferase involved in LPS biosynthesis